MDITDLRVLATVLAAASFVAIAWWAFSPRRRKDFDEAAQIPFDDEDQDDTSAADDTGEPGKTETNEGDRK